MRKAGSRGADVQYKLTETREDRLQLTEVGVEWNQGKKQYRKKKEVLSVEREYHKKLGRLSERGESSKGAQETS